MFRPIYSLLISGYEAAVKTAALFGNNKARERVSGAENWETQVLNTAENARKLKTVWFHCASMGEYEQALPVMELIKKQNPGVYLYVTYFSPAGYNNHKSHGVVDGYGYLPYDKKSHARKFCKLLQPEVAVFVKYELWLHFLEACNRSGIPFVILSAVFRPSQVYFKSFSKPFQNVFQKAHSFLVQNEESKIILNRFGVTRVQITGDTRFDRVFDNAQKSVNYTVPDKLRKVESTIIFGSAWEKEEELFLEMYHSKKYLNINFIFAPHELSREKINRITNRLQGDYTLFSNSTDSADNSRVLIIDTIGDLKYLYRYADAAVVGGGFNDGLHNVLEASVYGIPVLFGPEHDHFPEAFELIRLKCGFAFENKKEFFDQVNSVIDQNDKRAEISQRLKKYFNDKRGASQKAANAIGECLKG